MEEISAPQPLSLQFLDARDNCLQCVQLSDFLFQICLSSSFTHSSKIKPTFCLSSITAWETIVHVFETPRFTNFPITNMGSFSPAALAAAVPVRRKLYLPSAHFPTFMCKVIWGGLGRTGQIHPRYIYILC